MSKLRWKLPADIRAALDETGLPWTVEFGSKHVHIRVAGNLAAVMSQSPADQSRGRGKNVISAIRRAAREHTEAA